MLCRQFVTVLHAFANTELSVRPVLLPRMRCQLSMFQFDAVKGSVNVPFSTLRIGDMAIM